MLAVSVVELVPGHIVPAALEAAVAVMAGPTATVAVAVFVQPFPSVPVTV